jgi:hypothetical protein
MQQAAVPEYGHAFSVPTLRIRSPSGRQHPLHVRAPRLRPRARHRSRSWLVVKLRVNRLGSVQLDCQIPFRGRQRCDLIAAWRGLRRRGTANDKGDGKEK